MARASQPRHVVLVLAVVAATTVVLDQLTKVWALSALTPGVSQPFIATLLQFTLTFNSGAALSLGSSSTWVFTILSLGTLVLLLAYARRIHSVAWAWAGGLLMGGATGNLIDRLFRAPGFPNGHVVDFIDYGVFIGNVADIAIVGAGALIIWLTLRGVGLDGTRDVARPDDDVAASDARDSDG